ncbi:MAG: hypothetical protein H7Y37_08655 [Anaerolineae bacterium]|nr:hypothetical protein [Gloeobacterales cyanobacterium ES-bin-313]
MRPALDPLSFTDTIFIGDTLVAEVKGRNLADVTGIFVKPGRGVEVMLGDPLNKRKQPVETGPESLTITVVVEPKAFPGDRRIWVTSADGESNQLLLIVMM